MPKPKIFIASSTRLLNIAKALKNHLLLSETCDADLWSEVSQGQIGSSIVEMLLKATSEYDFAVIILGKDDVTLTEKGEETRKSRDNCIFEAGLFMGVIGQKRCLLLTSLEEKANEKLPADLGGLIYLKFVEPTDFDDEKQCIDETKLASLVIGRKVRAAAPLSNRPLTEKALLEREKRTHQGGELLMDQVVVSAIQPLDLDYDGASQVRQNIDSGNIRYVYFFQGNKEGAQKTCELLQIILLANILKNQHDVDNWPSRLEKLKINSSQIIDDLKLICDRERIKIFFFPAQPPSVLQYCIHNAGSTDNAKLYLKRKKDEYIEWVSGLQAYQFWDGVRQARGALNPLPPKAVIYGIPGFNVKEGAFLKILEEQVTDHFPEIDKDILRLCLEGTDEKSQ